ncbi:hypothetical protein K458DRAFT_436371 [Lentithecium fluviatile CBS 122367]|uniref:Uncharacterized protein n=1 Tax=Lentithecium fluviatile CBS 122367 TaxID=1168545 RepID=A0A6G1IIG5_9PLEO|nr:hypothetical protein K458DRAFT_436371 [Lentithecium fluviatile CBS 122367]
MTQNEFEMGNMSSPSQEHSGTPKTTPENEVPIQQSPHSSITAREPTTILLPSRLWPIFVSLVYAALALLSWTFICVMSKRPIRGEKSYYTTQRPSEMGRFATNERYYRAARILQTMVGLLMIPVTNTICSVACVAYMQTGTWRKSLTLRQSMALADQGWTSPRILPHLAILGSLPLYVAFAVTLFGCVFQVLQSVLVEQEHILAGISRGVSYTKVPDLPYLIQPPQYGYGSDGGVLVHQLRGLLETTNSDAYDSNLWGEFGVSGIPTLLDAFKASSWSYQSVMPYVAPLPVTFNSGAYPQPQYAPRLNSTLEYTNPTQDEWERECRNETDSGGFYALYEYDGDYMTFEACMAGDLRATPWSPIRDRQDITETLYFRISYGRGGGDYVKVEANSTLGYFEVPSQLNDNRPGPLLDKDPITKESDQVYTSSYLKREANSSYAGNTTLMQTNSQGPLAMLTLALFGPGSFVASRLSNTSSFIVEPSYYDEDGYPAGYGNCVALMPLSFFFSIYMYGERGCVKDVSSLSEVDIALQVRNFLTSFLISDSDSARGPLEAGLFMANKLWLLESNKYATSRGASLTVHYDDGILTTKPKMSTPTLVIGSVLLGLHVLGLVALTVYAWTMRPWIGSLGADVMVRMGVVYTDVLGTTEGKKNFNNEAGKLPGFIGDENPEGEVGRIRVGAMAGLTRVGVRSIVERTLAGSAADAREGEAASVSPSVETSALEELERPLDRDLAAHGMLGNQEIPVGGAGQESEADAEVLPPLEDMYSADFEGSWQPSSDTLMDSLPWSAQRYNIFQNEGDIQTKQLPECREVGAQLGSRPSAIPDVEWVEGTIHRDVRVEILGIVLGLAMCIPPPTEIG